MLLVNLRPPHPKVQKLVHPADHLLREQAAEPREIFALEVCL